MDAKRIMNGHWVRARDVHRATNMYGLRWYCEDGREGVMHDVMMLRGISLDKLWWFFPERQNTPETNRES